MLGSRENTLSPPLRFASFAVLYHYSTCIITTHAQVRQPLLSDHQNILIER